MKIPQDASGRKKRKKKSGEKAGLLNKEFLLRVGPMKRCNIPRKKGKRPNQKRPRAWEKSVKKGGVMF